MNNSDLPIVYDNLTRILVVSSLLENALDIANQLGVEIKLSDNSLIDIDTLNYEIL